MASNAHNAHSDQATPGTMDITENLRTWNAFWILFRRASGLGSAAVHLPHP
jgi:hypothetical protein